MSLIGPRGRRIPALVACFYAGGIAGWLLHATFSPARPISPEPATAETVRLKSDATYAASTTADSPAATTGDVAVIGPNPIAELKRHVLRLPIDDASIDAMEGQFAQPRGATRAHEAVDILAPRHTPVRAVEAGTIAKLFYSKAGGTTIYQFDPSKRFIYYYAHLQRYADGLREGQQVSAGETIGYVGTSGNAPPGTPHLHFAISLAGPEARWWEGKPIDPYLVFQG
jgi:murein DD-endopeptidase MepM/ murein hydrolase activator NlpD